MFLKSAIWHVMRHFSKGKKQPGAKLKEIQFGVLKSKKANL